MNNKKNVIRFVNNSKNKLKRKKKLTFQCPIVNNLFN